MENIGPNENWAKEAADFQSVKRAYKWMSNFVLFWTLDSFVLASLFVVSVRVKCRETNEQVV